MTPAQARQAYKALTEVQMLLANLPKKQALQAYNKINKVKFHIKKISNGKQRTDNMGNVSVLRGRGGVIHHQDDRMPELWASF